MGIRKSFLCKFWGRGIFWLHQQTIHEGFLWKNLVSTNSWKFLLQKFPAIWYPWYNKCSRLKTWCAVFHSQGPPLAVLGRTRLVNTHFKDVWILQNANLHCIQAVLKSVALEKSWKSGEWNYFCLSQVHMQLFVLLFCFVFCFVFSSITTRFLQGSMAFQSYKLCFQSFFIL